MTYNYYTQFQKQSNKISIKLFIRENGKTFCLHSNEYIETRGLSLQKAVSKFWDKKLKCIKTNYIGAPELNQYLFSFKNDVMTEVRKIKANNPQASFDKIKNSLTKKYNPTTIIGFWETFEQFIEIRKNEVSKSTTQKFVTLKTLLNEFSKNSKYEINFNSLDLLFKDKFNNFLVNVKNQSQNTISKYFDLIRTFLNWCVERNITQNENITKLKTKSVPTDIVYLTQNELNLLFNYDFSVNTKYERTRDIFCFLCFTGQRFSDMKQFQFKDVVKKNEGSYWILTQQKTKEKVQIPLSDRAISIINKYTQQKLNKLPTISNQKTNEYIKIICKEVGINSNITNISYSGNQRIENEFEKWQLITSHTGRRTFVTLSLELGMRPEVLMKITGHSDSKSFQKYIKITESIKMKELQKVWNK